MAELDSIVKKSRARVWRPSYKVKPWYRYTDVPLLHNSSHDSWSETVVTDNNNSSSSIGKSSEHERSFNKRQSRTRKHSKKRKKFSSTSGQVFDTASNSARWYPTHFPVYFSNRSWLKLHLYPSEPLAIVGVKSGVAYAYINSNIVIHSEGLPEHSNKDIWEIYSKTTERGIPQQNPAALVYKVDPVADYVPVENPEKFRLGL